jgi:3-isopropylmalate/(R)-2-methylmalate dehydratase small subunit
MNLKNLRGRVAFMFVDDDYDIDLIVGVKNIRVQDREKLRQIVMQSIDPSFASSVQPGDILIGGRNFGYGHPHYPPMTAMRDLGLSGVIAESFAPGYLWDQIEVVWSENVVRNLSTGSSLPFEPLTNSEREILIAGGLVKYLQSLSTERPV